MFTGIITAIGTLSRVSPPTEAGGLDLEIAAPWSDVAAGESIAVDGVCLTVTAVTLDRFTVHVAVTTLERTRFRDYRAGQRVNLERAARLGDRLGGHLVQGHVDGVGRVVALARREDALVVDLEVPEDVAAVSVPRGSIAVDGVSLTVVERPDAGSVRLALVPYTLQETTLARLAPGAEVHVEGDVIGKYVVEWLGRRQPG